MSNEFEAQLLQAILDERKIEYYLKSFYDVAYDGLFQKSQGWGAVFAPEEFESEIMDIIEDIRKSYNIDLKAVCQNIASCAEATTKMRGGYCVMVGKFKVITLSDGINQRSIEQQLQLLQGNTEKIKDVLERAYPDGTIKATVNAFLINTGSKLVLIDTGNGQMGSPTMGNVVDNLQAVGYQPEQIDEIYLTHMHADHVGGLVSGARRVFANATVYANKREAEYWLDDGNLNAAPDAAKRTFQAAKATITPYINAGKFKTFKGNIQLTPGVRAETLFGHTPGHTAYVIESNGNTLALCGDVIHVAVVQFEEPSVTIAYDSDKAEAAKVRQQILAEAAQYNWLIGGAHLVFPALGHVKVNGSGYNFVSCSLSAVE